MSSSPPQLILFGISHKTAPVELREKLSVSAEKLPFFLESLSKDNVVSESVVLSTCNRMEIYSVTRDAQKASVLIKDLLRKIHQESSIDTGLYLKQDDSAVSHLFHVSSGLDSLVLGENEILGQVKKAYEYSLSSKFTGKLSNVLFQRALYLGKNIRTETNLSEGPTSVANLAVSLAERIFGNLDKSSVMVIGAGEMADLAARSFLSQKVKNLFLANRTFKKAQEMATRLRGVAVEFDAFRHKLSQVDIVLCSTGSPHFILKPEHIKKAMEDRGYRSLFIIDIAVPRDVDPRIHDLENVYVYNIDDLQSLVSESLEKRKAEIEKAKFLVEKKTNEFSVWYRAWQRGENFAFKHSQVSSQTETA